MTAAVADGAEPVATLDVICAMAAEARIPEHAAQELRQAADIARDIEHRIYLLTRSAQLYAAELGDRHEAAEILEMARLDAPEDKEILEKLADMYRVLGQAEELQSVTGNQLGGVIAHYYCELAESQQRGGDAVGALANLDAALKAHSASVRASLLEGDLYTAAEDHHRALAAYRRIEHQDLAYVQEALPRINACFEVLEDPEAAVAFLCELAEKDADPAVALALSQIRPSNGDYAAGREFLKGQLRKRPSLRGLHRLLELELEAGNALGQRDLNLLKSLIEELLADRHSYRCRHCGFPARSLHWQCPSCKHWNTVQPVAADLGSS